MKSPALHRGWTRAERELALRAIAIADRLMRARLHEECFPASEFIKGAVRECLRPKSAAEDKPTPRVDWATPLIREAFAWLYERDLARIVTDKHGNQIIVLTTGE